MKLERSVGLVLLLGAFSLTMAAFGAARGFYGYGFVPTARALPQGSLSYSYSVLPTEEIPFVGQTPDLQQHHALLAFPFSWMEVGAVAHRTAYADTGRVDWHGNLAGKIILPKAAPYLPALAFGSYDVIQKDRVLQHLYFVGGFDFRAWDGGLAVDLGAIYHRRLNPYDDESGTGATSFLAFEADYGKIALSLQSLWRGTRIGLAPSMTLKPFAHGPGPSWLEFTGGGAWRAPVAADALPAWGAVQLNLPLAPQALPDAVADTSRTWFWLDFNPAADHSIGEGQYASRGSIEVEGVAESWWKGLYLVNALAMQLNTHERDRLVRRDLWERSYLLYDSPFAGLRTGALQVGVPALAGGMLNSGILGVQAYEDLTLPGFVPAQLEGGYVWGLAEGWNATLEMPLHPQGSGVLAYSQFYAEGGYYLGNHVGFMGSFRQGSERNHLKLAVGYDRDARSILAEASVKFNWSASLSKSLYGVRARMAPNAQYRASVPLYVYSVDAPIYVDGNSARRLHNVPWAK